MTESSLAGPLSLAAALQTPPTLELRFYPYGVILSRPTENGGRLEYPVDPAEIATALSGATRFETGLLDSHTLYMQIEGLQRLVVSYREPERTAIFIQGSQAPFRIPLPGLVMIRLSQGTDVARYGLFAVKQRPTSLDVPLFITPLPNVYNRGSVCWGSVPRVSDAALASNSLAEDWKMLLGSAFTPHGVTQKSASEQGDIRRLYVKLEQRKTRVYPLKELIATHETLRSAIQRLQKGN